MQSTLPLHNSDHIMALRYNNTVRYGGDSTSQAPHLPNFLLYFFRLIEPESGDKDLEWKGKKALHRHSTRQILVWTRLGTSCDYNGRHCA